jgi:hypothetical protein
MPPKAKAESKFSDILVHTEPYLLPGTKKKIIVRTNKHTNTDEGRVGCETTLSHCLLGATSRDPEKPNRVSLYYDYLRAKQTELAAKHPELSKHNILIMARESYRLEKACLVPP